MPVNPTLTKALLAGVAAFICGAGLYWKFNRSSTSPPDTTNSPLSKLPLEALDLSAHDREVLESGEALFHQGQYAHALSRLNQFQSQDSGLGHLRAALTSAKCLLHLGNITQAEAAFRFVADHKPDEPDAHRGLATVYHYLGASTLELSHLERVAELDPSDYRPLAHVGLRHLEFKIFVAAEEAFRAALSRNPPVDAANEIRRNLAEALIGQQRYADSLAAISPSDTTPVARAIRAECLRMLNRPADATQEVNAGLLDESADPKIRSRLLTEKGRLLVDQQNDVAAATAFENALQDDEHNLSARLQFALTLRRLGQVDRAEAEDARFRQTENLLKKITELNQRAIDHPWDAVVRRELAEVCRKLHLLDMADQWLKAAAVCEALEQ